MESYFYYMAKKYCNDFDITILYMNGDRKQINRLRKYVRVVKWDHQKIICEKAFFSYGAGIIDYVDSKENILVLHTDYSGSSRSIKIDPRINRYIGVSQIVCDSFKDITGIEAELCYNPIIIDKPKKVLNLISATRLTKEKGKNRMIKFAEGLDKNNIPYLWTIFTNDTDAIKNDNVIYMKPKMDIINYIANSDYLVQLPDDREGYGYVVAESLSVGTPVIVTDVKAYREIGVKNNENGFILDLNLEKVNYMEIYKKCLKFEYESKEDHYNDILAPGKSDYKYNENKKYTMEAIKKFSLKDFNKIKIIKRKDNNIYNDIYGKLFPGDIFECSNKMAEYLTGDNENNNVVAKFIS